MRIIILYLFVTVLPVFSTYAQDFKLYNYYAETAGLYQLIGNKDSVTKYVLLAENICSDTRLFVLDIFSKYYHEKNNEKKMYALIQKLHTYGYTKSDLEMDSVYSFYLKKFYKKNSQNILSNVDFELIVELNNCNSNDQFVRRLSYKDKYFKNYLPYIDSINCNTLLNIIKTKGFPGMNQLGKYGGIETNLILHIVRNESTKHLWNDFFSPLLLEEASKGNYSYYNYAFIADGYNFVFNKGQLYGILFIQGLYHPFINIEDVDKRRKEIGLPPLWLHAKAYKIKLPEDYNQ